MTISRRQILAGAAATAAVAGMPAAAIAEVVERPFPAPPYVDMQTFFDGRVDWTFWARRREWVGYDHDDGIR